MTSQQLFANISSLNSTYSMNIATGGSTNSNFYPSKQPQKFSIKKIFGNNGASSNIGTSAATLSNNQLMSTGTSSLQSLPRGTFSEAMRTFTEQNTTAASGNLPYSTLIKSQQQQQQQQLSEPSGFLPILNQRINSKSSLSYQHSTGELIPLSRLRYQQQTASVKSQQTFKPADFIDQQPEQINMKEALKDWLIGKTDLRPDTFIKQHQLQQQYNNINNSANEASPISGGNVSTTSDSPVNNNNNSTFTNNNNNIVSVSKRRYTRPARLTQESDSNTQPQQDSLLNEVLPPARLSTKRRQGTNTVIETTSMQYIPMSSLTNISSQNQQTPQKQFTRKSVRNLSELLPSVSVSQINNEPAPTFFRQEDTFSMNHTRNAKSSTMFAIQEFLGMNSTQQPQNDSANNSNPGSFNRIRLPKQISSMVLDTVITSNTSIPASTAPLNNNNNTVTIQKRNSRRHLTETPRNTSSRSGARSESLSTINLTNTSPKSILKTSSSLPRKTFLSPSTSRKMVIFNEKVRQYAI